MYPPRRRMFMGKPGVYARKEISPTTEVHIPFLQAAVCCLILFVDALFILSWGLILPLKIVYITTMLAIAIAVPTLAAGLFFGFRKLFDWMGIFLKVLAVILAPVQILRLFVQWLAKNNLGLSQERYVQIDEFLSDSPAFIERHWTTIATGIALVVFTATVLIFIFAHNAWYDICVFLPHVDLPIPILGGYSWPMLGGFLVCVGIIGFALRPGRYPLGMTAFGGIVTAILQYFRPMTVEMTYGWTLPLYGIWASLCFAFIVGTGTLFPRFYVRDILEYSDYPEQRAPDPLENSLPLLENRSGYARREEWESR